MANDALTVALIELDAAWEAHKQAGVSLDRIEAELTGLKRIRAADRPTLKAFEKITSHAYGYTLNRIDAEEALGQILDVIAEARKQREEIEARQRKRAA